MARLSVVMPVFNAERYLARSIGSVLVQTFRDFELIVVDDGSTDGSLAIARGLADRDVRVRVIAKGVNEGNPKALNSGMEWVGGELVALMDADDECLPERFAKQVAFLDFNQDFDAVATQYWRMDADGRVERRTFSAVSEEALAFKALFSVPFCNPTLMVRRRVLEKRLPQVYREDLVAAQDFEFVQEFLTGCRVRVLGDYLFRYRVHAGGLSKRKREVLVSEVMLLMRQRHAAWGLGENEWDAVAGFLALHYGADVPLCGRTVSVYGRGLTLLMNSYVRDKVLKSRVQVFAAASVLEVKAMLRHRTWRYPFLAGLWCGRFVMESVVRVGAVLFPVGLGYVAADRVGGE